LGDWKDHFREKDAELVTCVSNPNTGLRQLTRRWTKHYDGEMQDALDGLDAYVSAGNAVASATVASPVAGDKDVYAGTWALDHNRLNGPDEQPGLYQVLNEIQVIDALALLSDAIAVALAALAYTLTQDHSIFDLFNFATGEGENIALTFRGLSPNDKTRCMETVTDADLVTRLAAGWTYADRGWKEEDNGTATFAVHFRKVTWNEILTTPETPSSALVDPDFIWYENKDTVHEKIHKQWFNIVKPASGDPSTAWTKIYLLLVAEAGYLIDSVRVTNIEHGRCNVEQVLGKKAVGSNGSELEADQVTVLRPHALQSGTLHRTRIINENLTGPGDGDIYNTLASASGYQQVDKKEDLRSDGHWNVYYLWEKVVWRDWADTLTPDVVNYPNAFGADRVNEVREWHGVDVNDIAAAVFDFLNETNETAPGTGKVTTGLTFRDGADGSMVIVQEVTQQPGGAAGITNTEVKKLDTHSCWSGLSTVTTITYENFPSGTLPAGTDPTTGNDYILNKRIGPNGKGRYDRVNVRQTYTWARSFASDKKEVGGSNTGGGHALTKSEAVGGVPLANLATLIAALQAADSGFLVGNFRISVKADGSLDAVRSQKKVYSGTTTGDAITIRLSAAKSSQPAKKVRVWWRRSAAAYATLTTGGAATVDDGDYEHFGYEVRDHGDGAYTIIQTLVDITTVSVYWTESGARTKTFTRQSDGYYRQIVYTKYTAMKVSEQAARQYINGLTAGDEAVVAGTDSVAQRNRYQFLATAMTLDPADIGSWTAP